MADYVKLYRTGLRAFLVFILVTNGIHAPSDRLVRLRIVRPAYRIPRP